MTTDTLSIILIRKKGTAEYVVGASVSFGPAQDAVIHRSEKEAKKKLGALRRHWNHWQALYNEDPAAAPWLAAHAAPCPELELVPLTIEVPR